jgi:hypothetical protein
MSTTVVNHQTRDTFRDLRTDPRLGEFHIEDLVLNKKVTDQPSLYRIHTEDKNREAVESVVAEYFDGFTLSGGIGYWKGNRHASLTIEVIANDIPHIKERVTAVARRIRELNGQECVLVQELPLLWCRFVAAEMATPSQRCKVTKADRKRFAKHEAGHAVVAMLLGGKFDKIWIVAEGKEYKSEDFGKVTVDSAGGALVRPTELDNRAHVLVCVAGVAGERINRKSAGVFGFVDMLRGAICDWHAACAVVDPAHIAIYSQIIDSDKVNEEIAVDKYINECLAMSWGMLKNCVAVHTAFVDHLLLHGEMDYSRARLYWRQLA